MMDRSDKAQVGEGAEAANAPGSSTSGAVTMCPHASAEQLDKLARGELSDQQLQDVRAHTEECNNCQVELQACQANLAYLAEVADDLMEACAVDKRATLTATQGSLPLRTEQRPERNGIPGYRILGELHRGGQGVVYEAVQLSTRRTVALKLLLEGQFAGEASRSRFQREIEIVAGLRHPNIVVIHESGTSGDHCFFAMDLVDGCPLNAYVSSAEQSVRAIIGMFKRICDAVAFAHRRGVMHRDLKPSNILVTGDGTPIVLDFGLAKIVEREAEVAAQTAVTVAGQVLGTVRYMSPEQTKANPDAVDIRTDVYSLGIVLYEFLVGVPPYDTNCDLLDAIHRIRMTEAARPSKTTRRIDSDLDAIILKAIEKSPDDRYQSAGEFSQDLTAWLERRPVVARSASSLYVLRKLAVRHRFATTVLTALIVIIGSSLLIVGDFSGQAKEAQRLSNQSEQTAAGLQADLHKMGATVLPAVRRQALGWFLEAWNADRLIQARWIRDQLPVASPEYAAMGFLLDDTYSLEQLQTDLPAAAGTLTSFVSGIRAQKAGQRSEAAAAFEKTIEAGGDGWLVKSADSRLQQLKAESESVEIRPGEAP